MKFENITIESKANIYFGGAVSSHTIYMADGTRKTLGLMQPGTYEFGTDCHEIMQIQSGKIEATIPGQPPVSIDGEGKFEVPANVKFTVVVTTLVDYICSYQ